jgi:hypothetical protein
MNNNREMALPEPPQSPWYIVLVNLLPWATLYGLTHTAIYYVFKYWSDSRDEAIQRIVDEKFKDHMNPLHEKIDKLTALILSKGK